MKKLIVASLFLTSMGLTGEVLGVGNFIHVVGNLDRSIEFYRDALGLEMTSAPAARAFSVNAVVSSLYNAPGAQSRVASFKIPDSNMAVEIVEFQGLNAPPSRSRFFDPGAITLTLPVQDLEAMKTRLSRIKGLEWISASASGRVTVRDPDGIFVELVQPRAGDIVERHVADQRRGGHRALGRRPATRRPDHRRHTDPRGRGNRPRGGRRRPGGVRRRDPHGDRPVR